MKRYSIWDKQSPILTPIGEVLSPEQWIERYPMAGLEHITVICAAGEINGGLFDTLGQMKMRYENAGCDFSACKTNEEILQAIEDFEDARAIEDAEAAMNAKMAEEMNTDSLASIAASMEFQNMMMMDDVEV